MIIDTLYQDVVAKLTSQGKIKEISTELLSKRTNDERVCFVYKIFEELNAFPNVQEVKKNCDVSLHYRNLGNTCFQQSEYHKAWQYYNLSLLNAPMYSETYCLALSNRSAAFYELEKYNECVQDIDQVLSLEYPQKIFEKLTKRKEMCKEALTEGNKKIMTNMEELMQHATLQMESPKDLRYVNASNKLHVVYSEEMGRHVIAKENIKVGEVLVEEDPYFSLLLKSQILCACSYCLSRNLNLLPCDSCCLALYCSIECKEKAWKEYHSTECPLMETLFNMDFTKLELLALRVVIKARNDHEDWNGLIKTIEMAEEHYNSEYRGHIKINDQWIYSSKYYAAIHTLATNLEKRSVSDIFQKAVTAVVFLRFLERNTKFLKFDCDKHGKENIRNLVGGLLLLHIMTSPTNMHGISTNVEKDGTVQEDVSLASAPYAFLSLLNHSCAPNVVRFSKLGSGKMKLFAIRPIMTGMQIFDNYGSHHALDDLMSRQSALQFQYRFTCMCEACVNNWPTYMNLCMFTIKRVPGKLSKAKNKILNPTTIESLQKGDLIIATKIYKRLCILCETLEPYAPCMELCDCQESLKQCLAIFEGLSSYGSTQLIAWENTVVNVQETLTNFLTNSLKKFTL